MIAPLALALLAASPEGQGYALDVPASALVFRIRHPLHQVNGRAKVVEARAIVAPDGALRAQARAQVASMETGDGNRDANMREVLEADRHPYVVLRATSRLPAAPAAGTELPLALAAELDLHGVKRPMEIPVTVRFDPDGAAHVRGSFVVSLDAHRIERPALLFRKVDDSCRVELDLVLRPEAR